MEKGRMEKATGKSFALATRKTDEGDDDDEDDRDMALIRYKPWLISLAPSDRMTGAKHTLMEPSADSRDLRLIRALEDSPDRPGDGISGRRQEHGQRLNRFNFLRRDWGLRRVIRRNSLLLQTGGKIRAEGREHLIGHLLDHPAAHLGEQTHHIDFRHAYDFGPPVRKRLNLSGHLHRCAAFASDVLTFAHEFDLVFLVIESLNLDLAFVICNARADLDLDHPFERAIIDRLGDLSAGKTVRDLSRVAEESPDALQRLWQLKGLLNSDGHTFLFGYPFLV